jgi:hypothetical protein
VAEWPWRRLVASADRRGGDGALSLRIALLADADAGRAP